MKTYSILVSIMARRIKKRIFPEEKKNQET